MAPVTPASFPSRPVFSSYLLPSFKLPFRRRRQTTTSIISDVPSLSSSPESSASSSLSGSPTSSLPTYFDAVTHGKPSTHGFNTPPAIVDRSPRRLSRTTPDTLRCSTCSSDIAFSSQIVSKGFTGRYGRAYLVSPSSPSPTPSPPGVDASSSTGQDLMNIRLGKSENRQLVTGWHVVADINCAVCSARLGWKYVNAREPAQRYKVGKFILETERVVGFRSWEDVDAEFDFDEGIISNSSADGKKKQTSAADEVVFDSDDEDECEDIFAGTWDPVVVAQRRTRKMSRKQGDDD